MNSSQEPTAWTLLWVTYDKILNKVGSLYTVNSRLSGGGSTSLQINRGKKIHNKKLKLFSKIIFEKRRAQLRNRLF
jgi:hypothetical protein